MVAASEPRVLASRYELHHRLGRGGAGTVWRGFDRALDRPVAVKLLHDELAEDQDAGARFRTEATAAAKLTHPNAVLVYDLGTDGDETYLVMELVEGVNLADVLRTGPLPAGVVATLGAQVGGALGVAHAAGIVHRDVKPGNVLVTTDGIAKLADFGIARALGAVTSRLTRTGMVLGTARYLAPEQLRDDPVDARADVFALGLVLHECLTGAAPFGEGNPVEVAARRLTTSLPRVTDLVPGVPPGLDELIGWATRVDPRERPADGTEFADALQHFAATDATASLAGRVAQVPERNTTPVASDRIDPIDLAAEPSPPAAPSPPSSAGGVDPGSEADPADADAGGATQLIAAPAAAGPSTGRRWVLGAVAAVAVLLVALGLNATNDGGDDERGGEARGAPTADAGTDDDQPLTIADAGDHDPEGDQREHPQDVPLAFDGDPETFWQSERYESSAFSGLDKSGVGIWLELEEPTAIDRVEVELSTDQGTLELWASEDGPPDARQLPDDWGSRLGGGDVPAAAMQFPDLPDHEVRTVLLWFTDLPEGGGGWRAEVREVRLIGR